jgi:hypothetical protein
MTRTLQTLSRLDHLPPPPFQGDGLGFFLSGPLQSASPFDRSTGRQPSSPSETAGPIANRRHVYGNRSSWPTT